MSLKLEVDRLVGRMVTRTGRSQPAAFFIHDYDNATLCNRLNEPTERFIPAEIDGATSLVNVDWIAYIAFDTAPPEVARLESIGVREEEVELELTTGETLKGRLFVEGGSTYPRVSDYLNAVADRFVLLCSASHTLYINRQAIARLLV